MYAGRGDEGTAAILRKTGCALAGVLECVIRQFVAVQCLRPLVRVIDAEAQYSHAEVCRVVAEHE